MRTITLAPDAAARWHRGAAVFETLLRRSAAALVAAGATIAVGALLVVDGPGWGSATGPGSVVMALGSAAGLGALAGAVLAFLAAPVLALVGAVTLAPRRPRWVVEVVVACWALSAMAWFVAQVLDNRAAAPYRTPVLVCAMLATGPLARFVPRRYDGALDAVEAQLPIT